MAQVRKDDIKERIFDAALEEFYEKDFKTATMRGIALRAKIPAGLIYTYYQNKQTLFDQIVETVLCRLPKTLQNTGIKGGIPFDRAASMDKVFALQLFEHRRALILLTDKSKGTGHQHAKENIIRMIEEYIKASLSSRNGRSYDDLLPHILAGNYFESLLEILRHYQSRAWAEEMLDLVTKQFFEGCNAL